MGGLQDVTVAIGCLKSAVTGVKKIFIKVVISVKWDNKCVHQSLVFPIYI